MHSQWLPTRMQALQAGVPLDNEAAVESIAQSISASDLTSPELRSEAAGSAASKVRFRKDEFLTPTKSR